VCPVQIQVRKEMALLHNLRGLRKLSFMMGDVSIKQRLIISFGCIIFCTVLMAIVLSCQASDAAGHANPDAARMMAASWASFSVVSAVALMLLFATIRSVTNSARSIASAAQAVARGDYSEALSFKHYSKAVALGRRVLPRNEFGQISVALGDMARVLERRERTLAAHADIGTVCVSTAELGLLLERSLAIICRHTRSAFAVIYLPEENSLKVRGTFRISKAESLRQLCRYAKTVRWVAESGKHVILNDICKSGNGELLIDGKKSAVKSLASIPVVVDSQMVGAALFASESGYEAESVNLMQMAVDQVAVAVQRALSYERTREAEEQARSDRELLRAIIENLPEGVIIVFAWDARLYMSNKAAADITGLENTRANIFTEFFRVCNPRYANGESIPYRDSPVVRSLLYGEVCTREEIIINRPGGGDIVILMNSVPIINGGTVTGAIAVFQDITAINDRQNLLKEIYEHQRNIAETLQKSFLPSSDTNAVGFDIADAYMPAQRGSQVGGDFFDIIEIQDGMLGIVIGDVSGKGVEAAVHTAMAKYMLRGFAHEDPNPASVLFRLNDAVTRYARGDVFVTLFYGILYLDEKRLVYANGGHERPLLFRPDKKECMPLESSGAAVGIIKGMEYIEREVQLAAGDVLVLYTDGVTEARGPEGFLCTAGLKELIEQRGMKNARRIADGITAGLLDYTAGRLRDDVALLVIKVDG
jgi:serine phosphatase RsbU (regulator of sigma subunit)/HAMP domain-containing protein